MTKEEIIDEIWDALMGSMDIDWNEMVGAKAVYQRLVDEGIIKEGENK